VPFTVVTTPSPSPQTESTPQQEQQTTQAGEANSAPQQENEQQGTQTPSPSPQTESAPQQENENRNSSTGNAATSRNSVPGFPTGTSESTVKAALGKPAKSSKGYWSNTRAVHYELNSNQVTLGYLYDGNSGRIRQTEVAFDQSVDSQVMQATLRRMLGDRPLINVSQGLQQVYDRRAKNYSFNVDGLEGVIERNDRDRIYIGVWDADLH
jgi:serine/threonine-protein kinase